MDYFKQVQYLKYISSSLPLFKDGGNDVYNCRCIICGDSEKDEKKTRGYFFKNNNDLIYKCHNCGASMGFISFLKSEFPSYYSELMLEELAEKKSLETNQPKVKHKSARIINHKLDTNKFLNGYKLLSNVPKNNSIRQYMINRGLEDYLERFYYIPNVHEFMKSLPSYKKPLDLHLPSVGIPHWSIDKERLEYMQMRMVGETNDRFRYLTLKVEADKNTPKIFGLELVSNQYKYVSVTEGAFDSLFVDNCISVSGLSDWKQLDFLNLKSDIRIIVDNDWRYNKNVKKILKNIISHGHSVVLLPKKYKHYKDINDMIVDGNISKEELNSLINEYTFSGLKANIMMQ